MIIQKIYKTDDGLTFNSETEAIAHEKKILEKQREKEVVKQKLNLLEKELNKKLDDAVKAYGEYSKMYDAYADEYEKVYGRTPQLLSDELQKLVELIF